MPVASNGNRRRVGLVIGAGGVKCAAALGLWKVLRREGIEVDLAVGCSGGSIYAAAIALGGDIAAAEEMTLDMWSPELMKDYTSNLSAFQSGERRFTERSGLVDDEVLWATLTRIFGEQTFAQTVAPLYLLATDFTDGEPVVISAGRIVDAVRASVAIPTLFPPWEVNGRLLVDGAASNPLPVDVAILEGADIIIAMGFELSYRSRMRSLMAVNSQLNSIYINNLLRASFAFHALAHHHEIISVLPEFERPIAAFDTQHIPLIIAEGERAAEEHVPYLRSLLESAPG